MKISETLHLMKERFRKNFRVFMISVWFVLVNTVGSLIYLRLIFTRDDEGMPMIRTDAYSHWCFWIFIIMLPIMVAILGILGYLPGTRKKK